MHEIVTLQIGEAANYLGTHFWNLQESYFTYGAHEDSPINHDVHFRPGVASDGSETFTPRTLIYDFKSQFGALRRINELYEIDADPDAEALSNPATTVRRQPPIPPHDYQQALNEGTQPPQLTSETVRYWSDFNRVYYNPKSIAQIHREELGPQQTSFSASQHGEELFSQLGRSKDLLDDDFRPLIEECNRMQGIQILTNVDDGWTGFTSRYLEDLRDEYGKSFILVWAVNSHKPNGPLAQRRNAALNEAHSVATIGSQADLYLPLVRSPSKLPSYVDLGQCTLWQASALQCCAMDTLLLPTKTRHTSTSSSLSLDNLFRPPNERQRLANVEVRFQPHGSETGMTNGVIPSKTYPPESCNLFPSLPRVLGQRERPVEVLHQLDVLRGSHLEELMPEMTQPSKYRSRRYVRSHPCLLGIIVDLSACTNPYPHHVVRRPREGDKVHENYADSTLAQSLTSDLAFPALDSFPPLYQASTNQPGKFSMRATMSTNTGISHWVRQLDAVTRPHFSREEREAIADELQLMAEAYQTDSDSNDDSDE
ncbi:MAG: hypothetical protein Q9159_004562 [Coniocarpon cinnabarinum]